MKKIVLKIFSAFLCSAIVLFSSCSKESRWDCVKGTGKKTTVTRPLASFNKIYVNGNIDVILRQGSGQEVTVEAGGNLLPEIKTEVVNGELHIDNHNKCNWARSYKKGTITINVTLEQPLRYLWTEGSGLIKSTDTLICDFLKIWAHQSGNVDLIVNANYVLSDTHTTADLTLHGKTGLLQFYHTGEGYLHLEDLQANDAWIYSNTSGDAFINVLFSMEVTLNWVGNIYYKGNPSISLLGSGKGKLIQQN